MWRFVSVICFLVLSGTLCLAGTGGEFRLRGQASGWLNVNPENDMPLWTGARYIPQANYGIPLSGGGLIDFELSANITGSSLIDPFERFDNDGNIKLYRTWARYSANQLELRLGLQKINFGSASMVRPLMWFDQVDPRDPLQITDGVWALLGRYYFLNNTNIWLWVLYGNEGPKTWEIGETTHKTPEFGGRIQAPVLAGEAAFSFHHRKADIGHTGIGFSPVITGQEDMNSGFVKIPENRFGFDARWDVEIGFWIEGALIQKREDVWQLTNQHLFTAGADYTFGIGNGLYIAAEQLMISFDHKAFQLGNRNNLSALSLSYPLGVFDNISVIVYRDWTNDDTYSFVNWHRQFDRLAFYLMVFRNPETFQLPQQAEAAQMFSGRGFQAMLVFNH